MSQHTFRHTPSLWQIACLWTILLLTLWAFMPGTGGTLIFDDIPNLLPWQTIGDIDSLAKAMTFVTSGTGTPGRPLSLLSFLIDDQNWSPDVYSLKRTNLAIHLINSCLVYWLCLKLLAHLLPTQTTTRQGMLALLVTAIWSLHPLQVSNVSYVIQRMNLLSTLLELIGLIIFIRGRELLETTPRVALLLCTVAIGLFMPLAILAKENGLLLCVFALLVEAFCFSKPLTNRHLAMAWRIWKALFLWLPLLAFIFYCLFLSNFSIDYHARSFTATERLLTQGPVLTDYLSKLLIPRLHGSGLYFDNFPISHSLINPPQTLLCWLIIASLLGSAWHLRRRLPLFAFGIFFYFGGHLMESTLLPLELYFEHRNYLPQTGLWLSLAAILSLITKPLIKKSLTLGALLLVGLLSLMTRHNAELWGKPELQTTIWYHDNPGSLRTTLAYANLLLQKTDYAAVNTVLATGLQHHPDSLVLAISQRYVACYWQNRPVSFTDLPELAKHAGHEYASIIMLEKMREMTTPETAKISECQPATASEIARIYLGLLENPKFVSTKTRTRLFEYLGEIAVEQGQLNEAIHYYDEAFANSGNPVYPYRQATLLQSAGLPESAQDFVSTAWRALGTRQKIQYPELESRLIMLEKELDAGKEPELPVNEN